MSSVQMTSPAARYSPLPSPPQQVNVTLWDLFVNASKAQYGDSIEIHSKSKAMERLNSLNFEISILSADAQPIETRRAIVDINTKEYTNHCQKEVDETLVKVRKSNAGWAGSRYHFSTTRGAYYGIGGDIGPQVIYLAIAGGSTGINVNYNYSNQADAVSKVEMHNLGFNYTHEEKISVPPMSRVKAKITSHSVQYEQGYVILFTLPASLMIPVTYRTRCQRMFGPCCRCFNIGAISAAQLCCTLPEYRNVDGYVRFVQRGILSWIGEGSNINKEVEPLQ